MVGLGSAGWGRGADRRASNRGFVGFQLTEAATVQKSCWNTSAVHNNLSIIKMYYPFLQYQPNFFPFACGQYPTDLLYSVSEEAPVKQESPPATPSPKLEESPSSESEEEEAEMIISLKRDELEGLSYDKKKQAWTQEEDKKLLSLVDLKMRWERIAQEMPGRSLKMCYSRFKRLRRRESQPDKSKAWSREEDIKLIQLIEDYGQNWKELSIYFSNRKPKQLRERYINALTPNLSKQPWTLDEDLKLIELYNKIGKKWKLIARKLNNRSENQVKNRFYGRILPLQKKKVLRDQQ